MFKISEKTKGRLIAAGMAVAVIAGIKLISRMNVPFIGGVATKAAGYL